MSLTLFSLPFELRQQIYDLVLVSPTLHLCAPQPQVARSRIDRSRKYAHLKPAKRPHRIQLLPCDPITSIPLREADALTFGFMFTNRQIYEETKDAFWSRNTLCFIGSDGVVRVLKEIMGQAASRQVQKIRINLRFATPYALRKEFEQVLGMLASRTRKGCLKEITVRLPVAGLAPAVSGYPHGDAYECLLETLQKAGETRWARGTKRTLLLGRETQQFKDSHSHWYETYPDEMPDWIVREMAWAWGGFIIDNGEVVWEDSKQVGSFSLPS